MSTEAAKRLAHRFSDEFWGQGRTGIANEIFAPEIVNHSKLPHQDDGPTGFLQDVEVFRSAIPDLTIATELVIAEGDLVVIRWRATGTHTGDLMGVPASGVAVAMSGIDIFRSEHGRFVERWGEFDGLGLMQQIGTVGAPA
jgi:predicted ester cyclase